jgi:hypothetical protein
MQATCLNSISASVYERVLSSLPPTSRVGNDLFDGRLVLLAAETYCPPLFFDRPAGGFIAGGFVRDTYSRTKPRDLDLYVTDNRQWNNFSKQLTDGGWIRYESNAITVSWTRGDRLVQLVRTSRTSVECIARFDLTVCCAAVDISDGKSICLESFVADVDSRRLKIHQPAFPVDTLRRVARFMSDGYSIASSEIDKLHGLIVAELHRVGARAFRPEEAYSQQVNDRCSDDSVAFETAL